MQVYFPDKKSVAIVRDIKFLDELDTDVPKADVADPSDPGPACTVCKSKDEKFPSRMLLCDCTGCDKCSKPEGRQNVSACFRGYHMACLDPPVLIKPRKGVDWLCPECKGSSPAWEGTDDRAVLPCLEAGPWAVEPMASTLYPMVDEEVAPPAVPNATVHFDTPVAHTAVPAAPAPAKSPRGILKKPDAVKPAAVPNNTLSLRSSPRLRQPTMRYSPTFLVCNVLDNVEAKTSSPDYPPDPENLEQAKSDPNWPEWLDAIMSELTSLMEKGTFEMVPKTPDIRPISAKWVFKRKYDAFGFLEKHKARLVCKGFLQVYGVDYFDVFSPVSKLPTLRALLAYAAANDLEMKHVDVSTAFLNGVLDEEVYINIPPGLEHLYPNQCYRLRKALYGLKQAPRVWWLNISTFLAENGFTPTLSDPCLFTKVNEETGKLILLLIYVDDCLIVGSSDDVSDVIKLILNKYEAKDLGDVKSFLNMAVTRDRSPSNLTVTLSQPKYVEDVATKFNFDTKQARSGTHIPIQPMKGQFKDYDGSNEISLPPDNTYGSLIGSLLYIANCTRPDISFAVSTLSTHLQNPCQSHMTMAKNVLRYLIKTKFYGLVFGKSTAPYDSGKTVELVGYSDSDYANFWLPPIPLKPITRRSITGFVFLCNGTPIAWQSKKQQTVSRSTDEAEFQAMAAAASIGMWLRKLFAEIEQPARKLMMFADNKAALEHVHNPGSIRKTKHVDIAYQFVLDREIRGDLEFTYVPSDENIADLFTKALPKITFERLRDVMGMKEIVIEL